jgi:hypothetical protein
MTAKPKFYVPSKGTAARLAAEHLLKTGPATEAELCAAVDLGCAPYKRAEKLQRAVSTGVLTHGPDGKLDCAPPLRAWFENQERAQEDSKPIGEITPAQYRPSVFASQGISKKNIPNRRGTRLDIPDWSQRPEGFGFKNIAGSQS